MSSLQWSWISGITTSGCVITRSFRRACKCLSNSEAAANKKEKSMKRIRNNTFHWLWRGSLYNLPTWTQLTHSMITVFLTASYWYLYFTKDRTYYAYIGRAVKNVFCLPFQEKLGKLLFFKLGVQTGVQQRRWPKLIPFPALWTTSPLSIEAVSCSITVKFCFIVDYTTVNIQTLILHFAYNDQCSVGYCPHEMSKCFVTFSNIGKVKGNITTPRSTKGLCCKVKRNFISIKWSMRMAVSLHARIKEKSNQPKTTCTYTSVSWDSMNFIWSLG